jgi:ssDNA-specific exonuclease RecJ
MKKRKDQEIKKYLLVLSRQQHSKLKANAAAANMSIKDYVVENLVENEPVQKKKKPFVMPDFEAQIKEVFGDNPPQMKAASAIIEERESYRW